MADFKTHITTSTVLGVAYGFGGYGLFDLSVPHCLIAGALCSLAGMLPDLDSDSGIPQREMLCFLSVLVPMLMLRRMQALGMDPETMVFMAGLTYVAIRFGVGWIFKRFTKHRGMWHSIPAALIAGLATFLICLSPELEVRIFKSWAVVMGFISHLILDEVYSVDWNGRQVHLKKSAGTAMKWFSSSMYANISTYSKLAFLIVLALEDSSLMAYLGAEPLEISITAKDWLNNSIDNVKQIR
jgi:membrane-bound metal-dependent hydrolase YbcI (DUF457 family)